MEFFIFLLAAMQVFVLPARRMANGEFVGMMGLKLLPVYSAYIIAASLYLVVYILKGIGLYTMARRAGHSKLWAIVAFIPFANLFLIGKLCGNAKLRGGLSVKLLCITTCVFEVLYVTSLAMHTTAWAIAISKGQLAVQGTNLVIVDYVLERMIFVTNILNSWILSFLFSFSAVALYSVFFRRYSPSNALLIVLLNIFIPVAWVFMFTCRNVKPLTPEEYLRQMQANRYANTPQNPNGYSSTVNTPPPPPSDPFAEFSDTTTNSTKNTDPFGYDETPKSMDPFDDSNTNNKG